jgi:hypothetical protein
VKERAASLELCRLVRTHGEAFVVLAADLRRQAWVCARLADECEDRHLAERLKAMACDLIAKADDLDELPDRRNVEGLVALAL